MPKRHRLELSQSSLQDFVDCRRRFWLRHMQRVAWPGVAAEPVRDHEGHMRRGERFHRLVQRYLNGVPVSRLSCMARTDPDPHLLIWWQNFVETIPTRLSARRHVEVTLYMPLEHCRLVAKFDLVQLLPDDRVQIFDWKTSLRRPRSADLRARLQSKVYPYVLVNASTAINGRQPITPEQIEMIYWFADPAQAPEVIQYNQPQFQADAQYLRSLVLETRSIPPDGLPMAEPTGRCAYCTYRSLCERGTSPGSLDWSGYEADPSPDDNLSIDIEQVAEISF